MTALVLVLAACHGTAAREGPLTLEEGEKRRTSLLTELRALVKEEETAGRYDCCVLSPCNHCALYMGGCGCGAGLRHGAPVCEECALSWELGQGAEDVDPVLVHSFTEAARLRTGKLCGE